MKTQTRALILAVLLLAPTLVLSSGQSIANHTSSLTPDSWSEQLKNPVFIEKL